MAVSYKIKVYTTWEIENCKFSIDFFKDRVGWSSPEIF